MAADLLLSLLRSLVEVAGFFLLGQGVLYVFAGPTRDRNSIYQLFCVVTKPVVSGVRWLMPRVIIDRHIPAVSFFLLFWLWIALAYVRRLI